VGELDVATKIHEDRFKCVDCQYYQDDACKPYIRYDTLKQIKECDEYVPCVHEIRENPSDNNSTVY
jgi:hypothetical protein